MGGPKHDRAVVPRRELGPVVGSEKCDGMNGDMHPGIRGDTGTRSFNAIQSQLMVR
jgi:hypothetical protein